MLFSHVLGSWAIPRGSSLDRARSGGSDPDAGMSCARPSHAPLVSELSLTGLHLDFKCSASLAGFELDVQFYSDCFFFLS